MPPRKGSKRRRSVAFPEPDATQETELVEEEEAEESGSLDKPIDITDNAETAQAVPPVEGEDNVPEDGPRMTEKEQEIWETFREEHFEGAFTVLHVMHKLSLIAFQFIQSWNSCHFHFIASLL